MAQGTFNYFAADKTYWEMEARYEYLTSPENLACDGERSMAEQRVALAKIKADFATRRAEIGF